jgi:hypothetical protein
MRSTTDLCAEPQSSAGIGTCNRRRSKPISNTLLVWNAQRRGLGLGRRALTRYEGVMQGTRWLSRARLGWTAVGGALLVAVACGGDSSARSGNGGGEGGAAGAGAEGGTVNGDAGEPSSGGDGGSPSSTGGDGGGS